MIDLFNKIFVKGRPVNRLLEPENCVASSSYVEVIALRNYFENFFRAIIDSVRKFDFLCFLNFDIDF